MKSKKKIAAQQQLMTVDMIAEKLNVCEGTVRLRIARLLIKPEAKLMTGKAGRPALCFNAAAVQRITRSFARVQFL